MWLVLFTAKLYIDLYTSELGFLVPVISGAILFQGVCSMGDNQLSIKTFLAGKEKARQKQFVFLENRNKESPRETDFSRKRKSIFFEVVV